MKKKVTIILLFIIFSQDIIFGQETCHIKLLGKRNYNLDSLAIAKSKLKPTSIEYLTMLLILEDCRLRSSRIKFGQNFNEIYLLSKKLKNPYGMALFYYFNGLKSSFENKPQNAFIWFSKAINAFEKNNDNVGLVLTYLQVAGLNHTGFGKSIGNMGTALKYIQNAILEAKKSKNIELEVIALGGLSGYYYSLPTQDLKKIEKNEVKRLAMVESLPVIKRMKIPISINLSTVYFYNGQFEKAYKLLTSIREFTEKESKTSELPIFYNNLAIASMYTKRFNQAKKLLNIVLYIANRDKDDKVKSSAFENFLNLYKLQHNYPLALAYSDSIITVRENIFTIENSTKINELAIKYETEKKEAQNRLLQYEKRFAESRQRLYRLSTIFALLALAAMLFLSLRLKRTNNSLRVAFEEINRLNKARERFFGIIAHDLRRPMHAFQGMNELVSYYLKTKRYKEIKLLSESIDNAGQKIQLMLDNLLKWALGQQEQIPYSPTKFDLQTRLSEIVSLFEHLSIRGFAEIKINCKTMIEVYADKNAFDLIIRNLIDNAIKSFPKQGGIITIDCEPQDDANALITVSDTGKGMNSSQVSLIQSVFEHPQDYQAGQDGLGLGLILISQFVKRNKGKIRLESTEGRGISVYITLPQNS